MIKDTNISKDIIYIGADDKTIDLFESQYVVPNRNIIQLLFD